MGRKALTQSVNTCIVCIFSVMTHMTMCGPSWLLGLTCELKGLVYGRPM